MYKSWSEHRKNMSVKKCTLNSGHNVPTLGFGTYFGLPEDYNADNVRKCIESAIDIGYRHIDGAYLYQTEPITGKAIRNKINDGTVKREDLFITSKIPFSHSNPADVKEALAQSLQDLGLDYLDLYIIHVPFATKKSDGKPDPASASGIDLLNTNDHLETWKALEQAVSEGLVRSLGVSNFNKRQIENIVKNGKIKPAMNQVEIQPYFSNSQLVDYCHSQGIAVTAYTPLGQPHASWGPKDWVTPLENPTLKKIAASHNKSPAQVAMRFQIQRNIIVVAKATSAKRQLENFQLFDFELTEAEMKEMHSLNKNDRINKFPAFKEHKDYPFNEPF